MNNDKVRLTQKGYLKKIFQKFVNSTPLAPHFKLKAIISLIIVEEREYMSHVPYAGAGGSLMML